MSGIFFPNWTTLNWQSITFVWIELSPSIRWDCPRLVCTNKFVQDTMVYINQFNWRNFFLNWTALNWQSITFVWIELIIMASFHAEGNEPWFIDALKMFSRGSVNVGAPAASWAWPRLSQPELFFSFLVFWRWAHQFDETHNRPRLVCTNKFVRDTMEILCKIKYQVWIQLKPAISWQKCFWNWTPFSLLRCHTTRFWSWKRRKWNVTPLINRGVTFLFVALNCSCLGFNGLLALPTKEGRNKGIKSKKGAINCCYENKNFFPNSNAGRIFFF